MGEPREFPGRRIYNADRACEKSMGVGAIMEMDLPSNKARGTGTETKGAGPGGSLKSRHQASGGKGRWVAGEGG